MKKRFTRATALFVLLTVNAFANNAVIKKKGNDVNDPSFFTRKLKTVKAAPLTFNTPGKYLEYKRKQVMEGDDSARAYAKASEKMSNSLNNIIDYLPTTGGVLSNNLIINGTDAAWQENLLLIKPSGWGGLRFSRYDPSTANFNGNWALGYNANTGNDFSISNSYNGTQYDYLFHISLATRNVGIGTPSPNAKLEVNGNIIVNATGANLISSSSGNTQLQGVDMFFDVDGRIDFRDRNGSYASRLYIADGGNVGIGTTSPNAKLEINPGATGSPGIYLDQTADNTFLTLERWGGGGGTDFRARRFLTDGNGALRFQFGGPTAKNSQTFTDHLVIDGNGNVGIGTTAPNSYGHGGTNRFLEINNPGTGLNSQSHLLLTSNTTLANSSLGGITWHIPSTPWGKAAFIYSSTEDNELHHGIGIATNATARMYVHSNGSVGIGTESPKAVLDVSKKISGGALGTILARQAEGDWDGDGTFLGVRAWDTQEGPLHYEGKSFSLEHSFYNLKNSAINFYRGGGTTGGYMTFETNDGTEKVRIAANGYVGIGTTSPSSGLTVQAEGSNYTDGSYFLVNSPNTTFGGAATIAGIKSARGDAGDYNLFKIQNASGNKLIISGDGSIGIGATVQPGFMLSVNGDTKVRKLKVTITDWSDYVFAPSYQLLSLKEVEAYINKYKHLPDVPSAEEVQKEGLDVGGNQAILLKKIEELTLYVIQQQKEIEELKKAVKKK